MIIRSDITLQLKKAPFTIRVLKDYPLDSDRLIDEQSLSMALHYIGIKSDKHSEWKVKSIEQNGKIGL